MHVCGVCSSASGSDSGAYAVLIGTAPAPTVPDIFARRFPLPSRPNPAAGSSPSENEPELVMRDLRVVAPRPFVGGQWATFTGFDHRRDEEACIDFVFGRSDGGWCVLPSLPIFVRVTLIIINAQGGKGRVCGVGSFG